MVLLPAITVDGLNAFEIEGPVTDRFAVAAEALVAPWLEVTAPALIVFVLLVVLIEAGANTFTVTVQVPEDPPAAAMVPELRVRVLLGLMAAVPPEHVVEAVPSTYVSGDGKVSTKPTPVI